jgi:(p)ppGpp synthase/HD superfamily hydrolase
MVEILVQGGKMQETKDSFFQRLISLTPSQLQYVKTAYIFSKFGHRHQNRKELNDYGEPLRYFEHPRRVALICIDEASIIDPEVIQACLLHNTLEDTEDVDAQIIEHTFGTKVCSMILALTKNEHNKENYVANLYNVTNPDIVLVKMFDRLDNLRSLNNPSCNIEFAQKQIKETKEKYFELFTTIISERISNKTKVQKEKLVNILREIRNICS